MGDKDADGDGLVNELDGYEDSDGDGLPNYLDIDSDGDGILDHYEVQALGTYVKPSFLDVDKNGLDDAYDHGQMTRELVAADTDGDGIPDYLDLDSDNDNVPDYIEGHDLNEDGRPDHVAKGRGHDADGDGLDDGYETYQMQCDPEDNILRSNASMQDFDGDGIADYRDENDDDDEFLTQYEDLDGNGDYSNDDMDFDGYPEYLDFGRDCDLFIPDAFSPNKDGVHDYYQFYCINHFPNAKLFIFDQLGNKIYEKEHYGNMERWRTAEEAWWNGMPDRGRGKGERVAPGTYYYVLDLGNGEVKKSFVFVSY
jgi:gliding motility-associated-like protein